MTSCTIRYRLEGPGPSALLVDCEGKLRIYTRGVLGGTMPRARLLAILAERGCRWVPADGFVDLDLEVSDPGAPFLPPTAAVEFGRPTA